MLELFIGLFSLVLSIAIFVFQEKNSKKSKKQHEEVLEKIEFLTTLYLRLFISKQMEKNLKNSPEEVSLIYNLEYLHNIRIGCLLNNKIRYVLGLEIIEKNYSNLEFLFMEGLPYLLDDNKKYLIKCKIKSVYNFDSKENHVVEGQEIFLKYSNEDGWIIGLDDSFLNDVFLVDTPVFDRDLDQLNINTPLKHFTSDDFYKMFSSFIKKR